METSFPFCFLLRFNCKFNNNNHHRIPRLAELFVLIHVYFFSCHLLLDSVFSQKTSKYYCFASAFVILWCLPHSRIRRWRFSERTGVFLLPDSVTGAGLGVYRRRIWLVGFHGWQGTICLGKERNDGAAYHAVWWNFHSKCTGMGYFRITSIRLNLSISPRPVAARQCCGK